MLEAQQPVEKRLCVTVTVRAHRLFQAGRQGAIRRPDASGYAGDELRRPGSSERISDVRRCPLRGYVRRSLIGGMGMDKEPRPLHVVAVANCVVFVAATGLWVLAVYLEVKQGPAPDWPRVSHPYTGLLPLVLSAFVNWKLMKDQRDAVLLISVGQVGLFYMFVHVFGPTLLTWLAALA